MVERGDQPLIEALAAVAPGTPLRHGLDRIVRAKRGALIVVGDGSAVRTICTGGFVLDAECSPQHLSELAKMDGAIILDAGGTRIRRANVHLTPKASIPTGETGTRHRTAERVARSIDVPVVTVSEAMGTIAVYRNDAKCVLERTSRLIERASQALSTLQRFKARFDLALTALSTLEVEDTVSVRDVVSVLQPGELVVRIAEEIEGYLVELGEEGRLIDLQLREITAGAADTLRLVVRDYVVARGADGPDGARALAALHALSATDLVEPTEVAAVVGLGGGREGLDAPVQARGYRLLQRLPRVSATAIDRIVERFATLPEIMQASVGELEAVGGLAGARARSVKQGLARLAEASILARYD